MEVFQQIRQVVTLPSSRSDRVKIPYPRDPERDEALSKMVGWINKKMDKF